MNRLRPDRWLIAAIFVMLVGLTFRISGYPLLDPDEGRNAEVAREMASSNDYVVPRLNELPYLDKPVLYFAAGAAAIEVFGPTEFAVRLPSLLFTLATLALVGWFGWLSFGPAGGLIAAAATGATPLTLAFARTVIFDSALTFFVVLSILCFFLAAEAPQREAGTAQQRPGAWWTAGAWAAMACGTLTKGPIAIAIPLMVIAPYLGWRRRWDAMWDLVGVLLFVAILLPWVLAMSRVVPDFLRYVLVTETVMRLTTDELQRTGPVWYFLPILVTGAFPWSVALFAAWKEGRALRESSGQWDRHMMLFLLWVVVPLVFFSLSHSKRPQYLLPLIPAIGLLAAQVLTGSRMRVPTMKFAGLALGAIGVVILFANLIVGSLLDLNSAVMQAIPSTAVPLGAICIAAGAATYAAAHRTGVAVLALCVPIASIPIVSSRLMDAIGSDRSARELSHAIERVLTDETDVVTVGAYPLSLPFYLRRTLILSSTDGSELTSNFLTRTYSRWTGLRGSPLRPADWWLTVLAECPRPTVFVVRSDDTRVRDAMRARAPLIMENRKFAAYGPCSRSDLATRRALPERPEPAG